MDKFEGAINAPMAEVKDISEVDQNVIPFTDDLTSLQVAPQQEKVVIFDDPNDPNRKIPFRCRGLTPGEQTAVDATMIPKALVDDAIKNKIDAVSVVKTLQSDTGEFATNFNKAKIKTVVLGVVQPQLTEEIVNTLESDVVQKLYDTISVDLAVKTPVWTFPETSNN